MPLQTLYIDVYFLINFTVDLLALYFGARFSKVPTSAVRLVVSSAVGALCAAVIILMPEIPILKMSASLLSLALTTLFATGRISVRRRIKLVISFLIFGALVGGATYFLWGVLDKHLGGRLDGVGGAANKRLLLFAIIILVSIGVFKMIVSFFSNIESEGSEEIEISFGGRTMRIEAFVDSGNLAIDPMDMRPVLFIKESVAADVFPEGLINLRDPDTLERSVRRRVRLIPVSRGGATHVLTGVRPDSVRIIKNGTAEEICVTVAIDREGGSFGGFFALMPSSVACYAAKK